MTPFVHSVMFGDTTFMGKGNANVKEITCRILNTLRFYLKVTF